MFDTICAIATGQGGAIGIVRVSGPDAISQTDKIFRSPKRKPLQEVKSATVNYGWILDEQGKTIDEVLVSVFRAPHSYTGENSTEISCHNSPFILQKVVELLLKNNCRLAKPGEYTQRAFLNGKMDLSQAESVADLIAAKSSAAHRMAINQMKGVFSNELKKLRDELIHIASLMELELDFSDHEELEFADRKELLELVDKIETKISKLAHSFQTGNAIKNGIPVAIVGETNVGKSTLLNALLGEEKAIVSQINGTTRDAIEDTVTINGLQFRFIDTAGIRETEDQIEKLGIQKTFQKMEQASIVLWLIDGKNFKQEKLKENNEVDNIAKEKKTLLVINKADQLSTESMETIQQELQDTFPYPIIFISAKEKTNLDQLKDKIVALTGISNNIEEEVIVSNLRHYEALSQALQSIKRIKQGLTSSLPTDLIAQDLRDCTYQLSDIVGEVTSTAILHNIFQSFCIGK